ncbi:hypothetical protein MBANPS3_005860 [Mucor bainieri]
MAFYNTNSSGYTWSNLPSPVLLNVLHYAQQSSNNMILQDNASLISGCPLVCKGWSQAAQESLYKQVHLGSNALFFLRTITDAKELGDLVKILVIEGGIAALGDIFDILENISTRCPNIEELYSLDQTIRNDVWTYLTSARKVPQHLKAITTATSDTANSPLYPAVAIRFQDTLTRLQICFRTAIATSNFEQGSHYLLSKRLSHFVSLQQLRVDHWRVDSWQDFDSMLDRCSTTLRELTLVHLHLSNDEFSQEFEINCNNNVKLLKIGASNVPARTFQYFKSKFATLERLDLLYVPFPDGLIQSPDVWWAYLMELCRELTTYSIKLTHTNYQDIHQLRKCMEFSTATAARRTDIKNKTATLSFNGAQDKENTISLFKAGLKHTIYLEFDKVAHLELISQLMQMYSPHHLHIQGQSMENLYQIVTAADQIQEDSVVVVKSVLERVCNKSNVHMFFAALSYITEEDLASLHFDSIVLCNNYSLRNNTLRNLQVSNLKFTNSVLQHQVLECISKMFIRIDRLTLDTCCFLLDDRFELDVCLPFTDIATLELSISPFVNVTSWPSHKKYVYSECCSLENLDLLRAVSEDGRFIVKIETQDKMHAFYKHGAGDIKKSGINPNYIKGNAFNFVISVKCKRLEELYYIFWLNQLHITSAFRLDEYALAQVIEVDFNCGESSWGQSGIVTDAQVAWISARDTGAARQSRSSRVT